MQDSLISIFKFPEATNSIVTFNTEILSYVKIYHVWDRDKGERQGVSFLVDDADLSDGGYSTVFVVTVLCEMPLGR